MIATISVASVALSVHILAVVVAFGPVFSYPVLVAGVGRKDPSALPALRRAQYRVAKWAVTPALPTVLIAGIYLAASEHVFGHGWVIFSMASIIVLMVLHRIVLFRGYRQLACQPPGAGRHDQALDARVRHVEILAALLVAVTIVVMTAKPWT